MNSGRHPTYMQPLSGLSEWISFCAIVYATALLGKEGGGMAQKTGLESVMPAWAWFVLLAVCVGIAAVVGNALHPDANQVYRPPLATTSYMCNLDSYRQEMIRQGVEYVDEHSGDKFDEEAAKKRVLAETDAELDLERQRDLALTRDTYRKAGDTRDVCPGQ
jgi:hypothetical protein